jgi:hypothetical protein
MKSSRLRKLVRRLKIFVKNYLSYLSATDRVLVPKRKPVLKTCPSPTHAFTGREDIISQLHKCFTPSATLVKTATKQRRSVLHGFGGGGKTQVALKFVEECQVDVQPPRYGLFQSNYGTFELIRFCVPVSPMSSS